jgi:hypothetical protein
MNETEIKTPGGQPTSPVGASPGAAPRDRDRWIRTVLLAASGAGVFGTVLVAGDRVGTSVIAAGFVVGLVNQLQPPRRQGLS